MRESRFPPIAILLILIAAFAIYGLILSPGSTFAGMDFLNLGYPRAFLAREAFAEGRIPLWNWNEWGGAPLLATLLGSVLYPPNWLAMALPLPYGLHLFIFAHLAAAGLGTYVFACKAFRLHPICAAYAGIAYMGSAFFIGRIEQFQVVAVNCLVPWLLLALWQSFLRRRPTLSLPGVWAMMLLAGHPQFAVIGLVGSALIVFITLLFHPTRKSGITWPRLGWRLVRTGLLLFLGTALAAAQLLPTWELGQLSERIWPYPNPTFPELSWKHLPALIIPRYYNLITGEPGIVLGYSELGLYAGILSVPLAVFAVFRAATKPKEPAPTALRRRSLVVGAAVTWVIAMWIALGSNGYIATILYEYAPFFKQSRGAARSLSVASLMLALLGGAGLNSLLQTVQHRQRAGRLSISESRLRGPVILATAAILLITADLALNHRSGIQRTLVPIEFAQAKPLIPDTLAADLQQANGRIYRFMAFDSDLYLNNQPAAVSERQFRLQPNLTSLHGLQITDGYEEGLLPTRNHANLHRQFNRNLRNSNPDATLLAFLGANTMFTEYHLGPESTDWTPASPPLYRTSVVPNLTPQAPPTYTWWKSAYSPALLLSADTLKAGGLDLDAMLARAQREFPLNSTHRAPTSTEHRPHAFSPVSPQLYAQAAQPFMSPPAQQWNAVTAHVARPTSSALLLLSPYPGWTLPEKNAIRANIKPLNSIMYAIEFENQFSSPVSITLTFTPFSFRIGLFITLIAFAVMLALLLNSHIKGKAPSWEQNSVNTPA